MDIKKVDDKYKCVICVLLVERAKIYLRDSEAYNDILKAIKECWEWIQYNKNTGEYFYFLLDDEESGFTLYEEIEENKGKVHAWNCIIYSIGYISRMAYEKEGEKYFPEPIELVNEETIKNAEESLLLCNNNEATYIDEIYKKCLEKEDIYKLRKMFNIELK